MARREALLRLHKTLLARRGEILKRLSDDLSDLGGKGAESGDSADVAFGSGSEEMASQLAELDSRELHQIERALARLKQGTYGLCEVCTGKIPVGRLNALPYSTLCISCQREMEQDPDWALNRAEADWERAYEAHASLEEPRDIDLSEIEIDHAR